MYLPSLAAIIALSNQCSKNNELLLRESDRHTTGARVESV